MLAAGERLSKRLPRPAFVVSLGEEVDDRLKANVVVARFGPC